MQPSATGRDWEKYRKNFDEVEEKKITPLSDELVTPPAAAAAPNPKLTPVKRYPGSQDIRRGAICRRYQEAGAANKGETAKCRREGWD